MATEAGASQRRRSKRRSEGPVAVDDDMIVMEKVAPAINGTHSQAQTKTQAAGICRSQMLRPGNRRRLQLHAENATAGGAMLFGADVSTPPAESFAPAARSWSNSGETSGYVPV